MTIYTTPTCGKCKVLKAKLASKGMKYTECQDIGIMQSLNIFNVPVLEVDNTFLSFEEAIKYINER